MLLNYVCLVYWTEYQIDEIAWYTGNNVGVLWTLYDIKITIEYDGFTN